MHSLYTKREDTAVFTKTRIADDKEDAMQGPLFRIYTMYRDGFAAMTVGRDLWLIVAIKLLIMFAVLKLFFFPDYLNHHFATDAERAAHVLGEITSQPAPPTGRHE